MARLDNWFRCSDYLPVRSGAYLVYFETDDHYAVTFWEEEGQRRGEHDETHAIGWICLGNDPALWPSHWAPIYRPADSKWETAR